MKVPVAILLACLLCGCATPITFEPSETGAQHQCAGSSANLAQYNDCMEQVDAFYREYEQHRKSSEQDDG